MFFLHFLKMPRKFHVFPSIFLQLSWKFQIFQNQFSIENSVSSAPYIRTKTGMAQWHGWGKSFLHVECLLRIFQIKIKFPNQALECKVIIPKLVLKSCDNENACILYILRQQSNLSPFVENPSNPIPNRQTRIIGG